MGAHLFSYDSQNTEGARARRLVICLARLGSKAGGSGSARPGSGLFKLQAKPQAMAGHKPEARLWPEPRLAFALGKC